MLFHRVPDQQFCLLSKCFLPQQLFLNNKHYGASFTRVQIWILYALGLNLFFTKITKKMHLDATLKYHFRL